MKRRSLNLYDRYQESTSLFDLLISKIPIHEKIQLSFYKEENAAGIRVNLHHSRSSSDAGKVTGMEQWCRNRDNKEKQGNIPFGIITHSIEDWKGKRVIIGKKVLNKSDWYSPRLLRYTYNRGIFLAHHIK